MSSKFNQLNNPQVNIKTKLAMYWTSRMFLYIYADYFGLMVPGHLERMIAVETPVGPTTPGLLIVFSVLLIIPALMILGSVVLKPSINKWLNIVVGIFYAIISILMIVGDINNEWMAYFVLYQFVELGVFALIVVTAWKWPKEVR
ncbi:DUF6326 family protein [Allomuricauda sp. d1]|uniref:DUF6326 family protein n=1 Tax=Allomuricauda sp. d1 TaxID=3136725 RepID=UPI0031D3AF76